MNQILNTDLKNNNAFEKNSPLTTNNTKKNKFLSLQFFLSVFAVFSLISYFLYHNFLLKKQENFSKLIKDNNLDVDYAIISEAGASVYSASKLAKEEFPDYQVEERSAVSIARRFH